MRSDRCTCQSGRDRDGSEFGPCEYCESLPLGDREELIRAIHEALGGDGWAYTNYGGNERSSNRAELEAVADLLQDDNRKLGGDEAQPSEPNTLPTVQAETAVVSWRAACREEANALFAAGRYNDANRFRQAMDDFGEEVMRRFARRLQQPPVSTGEQPGMSEAKRITYSTSPEGKASEPFAYFRWNDGWNVWEEVLEEAAGEEGVVALYDHPAPTLPDDPLSLSEAAPMLLDALNEGLIAAEADIEERRRTIEERDDYEPDDAILPVFIERRDKIAKAVNFIRTLAAKQGGKS